MGVNIILYKTHVAGGLALGYIVFNNIGMLNVNIMESKTLLVVTSGLVLGSLFPDIDHRNSYLSKKVKPISFLTSKIFRHREFTHSIVGSILISILFYFILGKMNINPITIDSFMKAFVIGVISHILLDMMTVSGVVLLYPIYKKRIRMGKLHFKRSSKIQSNELVLMIIFILLGIMAYRGQI